MITQHIKNTHTYTHRYIYIYIYIYVYICVYIYNIYILTTNTKYTTYIHSNSTNIKPKDRNTYIITVASICQTVLLISFSISKTTLAIWKIAS